MPIDNRTTNLNLPLPHKDNDFEADVQRLRDALTALDTAVFGRAAASDITAAINALVAGAPANLNTLAELAASIGNDPNYASTVSTALGAINTSLSGKAPTSHAHAIADITGLVAALAAKLDSIPIATGSVVGGVKVGTGLAVDGAGLLSVTGTGVANSFTEVFFAPTSNGQTVLTPAGGYIPGQIELLMNGTSLYGGGDDYTATNGTTITLAVGANTTDTFCLRKWALVGTTDALQKSGDTMSGPLIGTDTELRRMMFKDTGVVQFNSGTTNALDYVNGSCQRWAPNTGAQTLSIANWPPTGNLGELLIEGVNLGAATITWPTINWVKTDGTTTTTFSSNGVTLQASGTDWVMLWTRDGGTTVFGKVVR